MRKLKAPLYIVKPLCYDTLVAVCHAKEREAKVGNIVKFSDYTTNRGCRGCKHLLYVDKDTAYCTDRDYADGSSIYPIQNGKQSVDWGACGGDGYEKKAKRKSNQFGRNII